MTDSTSNDVPAGHSAYEVSQGGHSGVMDSSSLLPASCFPFLAAPTYNDETHHLLYEYDQTKHTYADVNAYLEKTYPEKHWRWRDFGGLVTVWKVAEEETTTNEDLYWKALDEYTQMKRDLWRHFTDAEKEEEFESDGGAKTMAIYRKVAKRTGLPFKKCPTRKMFGLKKK